MQTPAANFYEFGGFQLDPAKRVLRRRDGTMVPLTPRVFDTLLYMVEHHDGVLDKEQIMEAVWPDSIVEENNLAQAIWKLRQLFGEKPGSHDYIVTVPGRGYRFVAEVTKRSAQTTDEVTPQAAPNAVEGAKPSELPSFQETPALQHRWATNAFWRWLAAAAAAVLILAIVVFLRNRTSSSFTAAKLSSGDAPALQSVVAEIPDKSIAVLPFENRSRDPDNVYFTDGVQDEILTDLARIADLKVISRTSVMQYKSGGKRNLRQIARELGVAHVLEGSVQRAANRVRVNAQLIDARTDAHLWAQTYDRDLADVFAIQSEIAKTIADQLQARLSPGEKSAIARPPTVDLAAFDLYSRAKSLLLTTTFSSSVREDLLRAADLLNQAVVQDPSFFQAYCQLAQAYGLLYFFGFDHTPACLALAEKAVEAASRLRPDAAETHLARARHVYWGYLDYDRALAELALARQSLPNDPEIIKLTALIERREGRWEESTRDLERTIEIDPRNLDTLQQLALNHAFLYRYGDAKSVFDRALIVEPDDLVTKVERVWVDLDWKADLRPLRQMIDLVHATDPTAVADIADAELICALAERTALTAKNVLNVFGENKIHIGVENIALTRPFLEGVIARMTNDKDKARLAFIAARAEQEQIVQDQPNYGPALCVLGLIDAGLGRREDALHEGRRAMELLPVEKDAINGPAIMKYFAVIAAWVGEKDLACEQIANVLRRPSDLSYGQLKLLPFWDPLRGDPRFEKIVASLAPPEITGRIEAAEK